MTETTDDFIARVDARLTEQVGGPVNGDPDYAPDPDYVPDPLFDSSSPEFEGGPFVNPETRREYWPGEPGDPYLETSLDEETEAFEPKEPIGADHEMSPKRDHYDRSSLVSDDLQETFDSLVDEGLIEVIGTRRDRPVYVVTTARIDRTPRIR